jgi:minor extracellular serine protease Vpr
MRWRWACGGGLGRQLADRPYITGSPAIGAGGHQRGADAGAGCRRLPARRHRHHAVDDHNTALVDWAPIGPGSVAKSCKLPGRACPGDPIFGGNSLAGKVALIDRATCSISLKVDVATKAGAVAVIVANNAAGDPPSFSFGGGDQPLVPTVVISLADGNRIKTALGATGVNPAVVASMSPATSIGLAGSMVASSSRGPGFSTTALKPEIGAPGASVSAIATTGTGEEAFGGTSGASPMVAGAAAILRGAYPERTALQIKAMLMNSANTVVYTNPATQPGVLAPISRIGAGELRVDRALGLTTIAHNVKARTAALPFGFAEVDRTANLGSELLIENFGTAPVTYTLSSAYRYASDAAAGATTIEMPASVTVPAGGAVKVDVRMKVDGRKLPAWGLGNAGPNGGNGALLEGNEVDGYVTVSGGGQSLTVPFHALLRKSASVSSTSTELKAGGDLRLQNNGVNAGYFDVFALTGTSPQIPKQALPGAGDNAAVIDLQAVGVRAFGDFLQFGVSRFDRRAHPAYPAEIDIYVDVDMDGFDDYVIYNSEATGFAATGQSLVNVFNLRTGVNTPYFYLFADLQSGNGVFTVPMAALGLTPAAQFRFSVYAFDNYFTGAATDAIIGMTHTVATPRYALEGGVLDGPVAAGQSLRLKTTAVAGGATASPSQQGFLLMYSQNKTIETQIVSVKP